MSISYIVIEAFAVWAIIQVAKDIAKIFKQNAK